MAKELKDHAYTKMVARRFSLAMFGLKYFPGLIWLFLKMASPFMQRGRWYNAPFRFIWVAAGSGRKSVAYLKGLRWGVEAVRNYFKSHLDAIEHNKPTIWVQWNLSPEPVLGLGFIPVTPEWPVALLPVARPEYSIDVLEGAEAEGVAEDLCAASKTAIAVGVLIKEIPKPIAIITGTQPCDSVQAAYPVLARVTGVPMFCLDLPYRREEEDFQYFTENVGHMISFLEEATGKKMDYGRLRDVLNETNKTNYYLSEISEMNKAIPCPSTLLELIFPWALNTATIGVPELTKFAQAIYEETRERFKAGKPGGPHPEKIRVVWHDVPIAFMLIIQWMEKRFGAYIVADMIGYKNVPQIDTSTKEGMIRGLAELYLNITMGRHFHGTMDLYLGELDRFVEEYKPDCLIFTCHRGCKQSWAIRNILKQKGAQYGLPMHIIEADIFDTRYKNEQQIKDQIEDFFISSGLA